MTKQLKALGQISEMILDLKLMSLQETTKSAEILEAKNGDMEAAKLARKKALGDEASLDLAQISGQDEAWNAWMQQERLSRNLELAKIYAEREDRMVEARHAMGRADVIKTLLAKNTKRRVG